jgi:D-alanyl-D-alanine carboxypeptidase
MKPLRFGSAVSAIALASMVAGCAAPMSRSASVSKGTATLAYALRAQMALGAGDYATAVDLAERAVEQNPQDINVRVLLGNAYFGAGRFASAEAAYGDALSLSPAQPQVILKRSLVQIALGKNDEAIANLQTAQGYIDAADFGLALALAGRADEAVQVLDVAARAQGADSRVRQNLALSHALVGDWTAARTVAAQDLTADLVDARVKQWMSLAKPAHSYDQVAMLVGVTPAAADPGQPVRLALNKSNATQVAVAAAAAPQAPVQLAEAPDGASAPAFAAQVTEPVALAPAPAVAEAAPAPAPAVQEQHQAIATAAAMSPEAPAAFAMMASNFAPKPKAANVKKASAPIRSEGRVAGKSKAVVQLGAYSSEERVSVAWAQLSKKYPALRNYSPMIARFDGPRGTVWRLSVRGFDNQQEAISRCSTLRGKGGKCFVRSTAGDSPVQLASR